MTNKHGNLIPNEKNTFLHSREVKVFVNAEDFYQGIFVGSSSFHRPAKFRSEEVVMRSHHGHNDIFKISTKLFLQLLSQILLKWMFEWAMKHLSGSKRSINAPLRTNANLRDLILQPFAYSTYHNQGTL